MNVLAIIPARAGSKGVPGKNIKKLAGKPLIEYTIKEALKSKKITKLVVSTDSEEIAKVAVALGVPVPFLRPIELSGDTSTPIEYIDHCLLELLNTENYVPDFVILLQPTSPFRTVEDIDNAFSKIEETTADSIVSLSPIEKHFHPEWQFLIHEEKMRNYAGLCMKDVPRRRQELEQTYTRNGCVYVFRMEMYLKEKNIYGNKCIPFVMPVERSINIDTMKDWEEAELFLRKY